MFRGQSFVECLHIKHRGMERNYLLWTDIIRRHKYVTYVVSETTRSLKILDFGNALIAVVA